MSTGLLLGIDHGGTTTTALVVEPGGEVRGSASVPMPKRVPGPDLVEHDPEDFLRTSLAAAHKALSDAGVAWSDVAALGIANQGETSMAWSAGTGRPFGPALSWEDRRTAGYCRGLVEKGVDRLVRERTGIVLDPYFSASKFHWLIEEMPEARKAAREGQLRLGGTDAYVIDRLTGGEVHATDAGTASRTALLNIREARWDQDLASAFGVATAALPEIRRTIGDFGRIRHPDVPAKGVSITADVVDAHAALFAQGCRDASIAKATFGTGAFIEVNTGRVMMEPDGRLPIFIAWQIDDRPDYTIEGSVFSVGSAIDWAVRAGWVDSAAGSSEAAESVPDAGGVTFVPSFTGLAAPYWLSDAKAGISGLGLDTTRGHIARALLDGIAFSCAEVIRELNRRLGDAIREVRADGGPTRNHYLMQRQADLLGIPVLASEMADMTAYGAALLAGIGAEQLNASDAGAQLRSGRTYEPRISADQREAEFTRWRSAIRSIAGAPMP